VLKASHFSLSVWISSDRHHRQLKKKIEEGFRVILVITTFEATDGEDAEGLNEVQIGSAMLHVC
jgi:hypothetical protein